MIPFQNSTLDDMDPPRRGRDAQKAHGLDADLELLDELGLEDEDYDGGMLLDDDDDDETLFLDIPKTLKFDQD